jgi:hypothetical protein
MSADSDYKDNGAASSSDEGTDLDEEPTDADYGGDSDFDTSKASKASKKRRKRKKIAEPKQTPISEVDIEQLQWRSVKAKRHLHEVIKSNATIGINSNETSVMQDLVLAGYAVEQNQFKFPSMDDSLIPPGFYETTMNLIGKSATEMGFRGKWTALFREELFMCFVAQNWDVCINHGLLKHNNDLLLAYTISCICTVVHNTPWCRQYRAVPITPPKEMIKRSTTKPTRSHYETIWTEVNQCGVIVYHNGCFSSSHVIVCLFVRTP